jgi:hypothetical protein
VAALPRFISKLFVVSVLAISAAFADVPTTLNYQGTLTDSTDQPINGDKDITFKLYKVSTGGTPFWTGKRTVPVHDGKLSVVLGPLDPKQFTGETYVGLQVAPDTMEMPRQKFTSVAYAFKAADGIPKGGIIMWSGDVASIPAGWALCDGANGTPDLRGRFIAGAGVAGSTGNFYTPGDNGDGLINISHTHSITPNSLSTNADGIHQHHMNFNTSLPLQGDHTVNSDGSQDVADDDHSHNVQGYTDNDGSHSHTINAHDHTGSTGVGGSASLQVTPRYYALAFIMKL